LSAKTAFIYRENYLNRLPSIDRTCALWPSLS
jgi:hypothetical protein